MQNEKQIETNAFLAKVEQFYDPMHWKCMENTHNTQKLSDFYKSLLKMYLVLEQFTV